MPLPTTLRTKRRTRPLRRSFRTGVPLRVRAVLAVTMPPPTFACAGRRRLPGAHTLYCGRDCAFTIWFITNACTTTIITFGLWFTLTPLTGC